ncbi:MAG: hypothetical protein AB7H66_08660 [Hyphomonadaceae bacterium]
MKTCKALAFAALALCAGCSSFRFEPTANWLRDGGRLCAANRDTFGLDYRPAAPASCAQALPASGHR